MEFVRPFVVSPTDGWADLDLGNLYDLILRKQAELSPRSTEHGCLGDALKAVELADICIEKREREDAA